MFLFTTPAASPPTDKPSATPGSPVVDAIRTGSERTGADFGYLLSTAKRESSLDPDAKAQGSSASGLFQFIEQTWLGTVKASGAAHGLGPYAQAITETKGGRFDVADPSMKAQILALRNDPKVSAVMAGEFTRKNAATLATSLGRQPSEGELYAAHFMGAGGAADLIRAAGSQPRSKAADLFPDQAASNRAIFYDRVTGQGRSVAEVHALLVAGQGKLAVPAIPQVSGDPTQWLGAHAQAAGEPIAAAAYAPGGPAMYGLFRTEGARGPVNQAVQRLWSGPLSVAQTDGSPRFFPRTASLAADAGVTPVRPAAAAVPASPTLAPAAVPLPPTRPASVEHAAAPAAAGRPRGKPLDLIAFLKARGQL